MLRMRQEEDPSTTAALLKRRCTEVNIRSTAAPRPARCNVLATAYLEAMRRGPDTAGCDAMRTAMRHDTEPKNAR